MAQDEPPRFRGSDFTMRWEQGRWSEERIIEGINNTVKLRAIPYGLSQVGPEDRNEIEKYWRKYRNIEQHGKRPDILIFKKHTFEELEHEIPDDPTITPDDKMERIIRKSIGGMEAENSLWKARDMPDYDVRLPLKTKDVTAPRIWVKEEDWEPLMEWSEHYAKPIWIVQVFYDEAFMTSLDWLKSKVEEIKKVGLKGRESSELQKKIGVLVVHQQYSDSTSGASQTKPVFTVLPSVAVKFGYSIEEPDAVPNVIIEDNGKIIPYVRFEGGRLRITESAVRLLLGEKV